MGQFFTDDIDSMLKAGHGDQERLLRIKSDFLAKKIVTIDDRRYVEGLISRYLKPRAQEPERTVKIPEKRIVPPPLPPREQPKITPQKQVEEKKIPKIQDRSKTRNVVIGVSSIVIAVLVISIVAMNQDVTYVEEQPKSIKNLELDQTSYVRGDIISVSGRADSGTTVNLAISNPAGQQVWSEKVTAKGGVFSTLVIAGGPGWEQDGRYTATSTYNGITETMVFDFSPVES
jgi:hypothetical protein